MPSPDMSSTPLAARRRLASPLWPLLAIIALLVPTVPSTALAVDAPYGYWGVDLLGTKLVEGDDAFGTDIDDESGSLRLYGGYRANNWLGLEGSLQGLGRYDTDNNHFEYSAATISGVLYLPLTRRFELYSRLGAGLGRVRDSNRSHSNTKPMGTAGIGAQLHINPTLVMRLGADAYIFEPTVRDVDGESRRTEHVIGAGYLGLSILF